MRERVLCVCVRMRVFTCVESRFEWGACVCVYHAVYGVISVAVCVCIVQSYFCYSRHGVFCSVYLCFISRISVYLSRCVICSVYTVSCVQASDGVSRVVRLRARVCPSYMRIRGFLCTRVCVCVFGLRCTPVFSFCQLYARSFCSSLRERVTSKGARVDPGSGFRRVPKPYRFPAKPNPPAFHPRETSGNPPGGKRGQTPDRRRSSARIQGSLILYERYAA